eukprot:4667918-Karenia_brevis.AAC.1
MMMMMMTTMMMMTMMMTMLMMIMDDDDGCIYISTDSWDWRLQWCCRHNGLDCGFLGLCIGPIGPDGIIPGHLK